MISWDVSPEIFQIGPISIRWYGLLFALCFILGYWVVRKTFEWEKKSLKKLDSLLVHIIVGTIIGARLGHVLFYEPAYYLSRPLEILMVWQGGLASHGATIGILLGIFLFQRKNPSFSYLWLVDRVCLAIPLGGAFVRLGNLFNSEIIGKPTTVPWAFVFERVDSLPRHPSQLYESLAYLALFGLMATFYLKSKRDLPGFYFGTLLVGIFSARFFLEWTKEVQVAFEQTLFLNMGQILSIPFVILGAYFIVRSGFFRSQKVN